MSSGRQGVMGNLLDLQIGTLEWVTPDIARHRDCPDEWVSLIVCERRSGETRALLMNRGSRFGLPVRQREPGWSDAKLLHAVAGELQVPDAREDHFLRHPQQRGLVGLTGFGPLDLPGRWFSLRDLPDNLVPHHRDALEEIANTFH